MNCASLFELCFDSPNSIPCRKLFLDICECEQTFSTKNLQSIKNVINFINDSLNHIEKCDTWMLMLLHLVVKQCSKDVLSENANHWIQSLLKLIQLCEKLPKVSLICEIICDMIPVFAEDLELHRLFSLSLLKDVVSTMISPINKVQVGHIACLQKCLKYFPGPCSQSYVAIEKYVISNLNSPNQQIIKASAQCFVLLPSLGGEKKLKNTVAWEEQVNKTFGSICQTVQILCQRITLPESEWLGKKNSKLNLPQPTQETIVEQMEQAVQQFKSLCICLQNFLSVPFPYTVRIPVDEFLGFAVTMLSVTPDMIGNQLIEDHLLRAVLPIIHCSTLDVLQALILSCHHNLIPHAQLICQLLIKNLQWSQTCLKTYQERQPFKDFRIKIYEVLQIWVQMCGAASGLEHIEEQLVKYFVADLTSPTNFIQLLKGTEKAGGSKKKGKQKKNVTLACESFKKDNYRSDPVLSITALKALKSILYAMGGCFNGTFHQRICCITMKLIQDLHKKMRIFHPPYDSAEFRQALYSLLLATVLVVPSQSNCLVSQAVVLFSSGSKDSNPQVSSFCHEAQAVCSNIIHPRFRSMDFESKLEAFSLEAVCDAEVNTMDSPVTHFQNQENDKDEGKSKKEFTTLFQTNNDHPKAVVEPLISSEFLQKFQEFLKTQSELQSKNKPKSPSSGEFHQQFLHFVHEKPHLSSSSQQQKSKAKRRLTEVPSTKSPSVSPASSTTENSLDAQQISQEEEFSHIGNGPDLQNLNSTNPEKDRILPLSEDTQEIFKTPLMKLVDSTSSADQEPKKNSGEFSWLAASSSSTTTTTNQQQMNQPNCSLEVSSDTCNDRHDTDRKRISSTTLDGPPEKKLATSAEEMLLTFVDTNPDNL